MLTATGKETARGRIVFRVGACAFLLAGALIASSTPAAAWNDRDRWDDGYRGRPHHHHPHYRGDDRPRFYGYGPPPGYRTFRGGPPPYVIAPPPAYFPPPPPPVYYGPPPIQLVVPFNSR